MSEIAGAGAEPYLEDLEEIAALYATQAVRVRRLVHLNVQAPDALVEDACQVAWMRLVCHRARVRRASATRWLVRVAVHEAFKLLHRGTRDLSLDELVDRAADAPLPAPSLMDELIEQRARLRAIRALPERQQRLVWLQGLGFSYAEMAGATGDSRRTVERQLLRAKSRLMEEAA